MFGHSRKESDRMARAPRLTRVMLPLAAGILIPGCRLAPRSELDECRRLSQTLRSENAQLKDRTLALQSQNRDLSERAVDDSRRLAQLEEVNTRLETSVQAYQDERSRLESAYRNLRASLPNAPQPLTLRIRDDQTSDGDPPGRGPAAGPDAEEDSELRKTAATDEARGRARSPWSASRSGTSRPSPPASSDP